jgi:hypothetical protein
MLTPRQKAAAHAASIKGTLLGRSLIHMLTHEVVLLSDGGQGAIANGIDVFVGESTP